MATHWLDPETRSILQGVSPGKETALRTKGYSLLLIERGNDSTRANQAIEQIRRRGRPNDTSIRNVVVRQLTLDDALLGQFDLSCSDSISAFVADEVVCDENASYLETLSREIAASDEYRLVAVRIVSVPHDEPGRDFCWQFLGYAVGMPVPLEMEVFCKKARLMDYWSRKCGVKFEPG